jgi:Uma2 family endonuclease
MISAAPPSEHASLSVSTAPPSVARAEPAVGACAPQRRREDPAPRGVDARLRDVAVPARQRFTFDEFLVLEDIAGVKHEFLDGQVWAMAGGSPEHAAIIGNVTTLLNVQLRGQRCRVHSAELRVRAKATGLGTYPDVTVVCGHLERDPDDRTGHTAINPRVIVEVLSPSTEDYDRGEKLAHYQTIPSLQEIVLVAHDRRELEVVRRQADGTWSRHLAGAGQAARLTSIGCELAVAEVYRDPLAGG